MRRTGAGPCRRRVSGMIIRRRRRSVRYTDRRMIVAIAQLDAGGVVLEFFGAGSENRFARLRPELFPFVAVFFEERGKENLGVETGAHFPRLGDVVHADGPAFRFVTT